MLTRLRDFLDLADCWVVLDYKHNIVPESISWEDTQDGLVLTVVVRGAPIGTKYLQLRDKDNVYIDEKLEDGPLGTDFLYERELLFPPGFAEPLWEEE